MKEAESRQRLLDRRLTCRYCGKKFGTALEAAAHRTRLCKEEHGTICLFGLGMQRVDALMQSAVKKFLPPLTSVPKNQKEAQEEKELCALESLLRHLTTLPADFDAEEADILTMRRLLRRLRLCPGWVMGYGEAPQHQLAHMLHFPESLHEAIAERRKKLRGSVVACDASKQQRDDDSLVDRIKLIQLYAESQKAHHLSPRVAKPSTRLYASPAGRECRTFSPERENGFCGGQKWQKVAKYGKKWQNVKK